MPKRSTTSLKASNCLKRLKASPERDARELELLGPLGTAYIASRGYAAPEVGPIFHRARALCEQVGPNAATLHNNVG